MKHLIISLLALGLLSMSTPNAPTIHKTLRVVIDVSHGGDDPGAQAYGCNEKSIVSAVADQIKLLNSKDNKVEIFYTRQNDEQVSLKERVAFVNSLEPDMLLSLHVNIADNEKASGAEVFYAPGSEHSAASRSIAEQLTSSLSASVEALEGETKEANFYILKNSGRPAVLLEMGYLSSPNDMAYLTDPEGQMLIAKTILEVLAHLEP